MGFTLLFLPTLQNLALLSTITARELLGIIHVTIYIIAILSFSKYCCQRLQGAPAATPFEGSSQHGMSQ